MSEKLPPHKAWDRAVESMLDDEAERISKMTAAELDRDLESKGVDPKAIRAKGAAIAARLAAAKRPETTATAQPAASKPPPQAAMPSEPPVTPAKKSTTIPPLRQRPKKPTSAVYTWGLAAAALAAALAFLLTRTGETPGPIANPTVTPPSPSVPPGPTPQMLAQALRREAILACDGKQWFDCRDKLDQAMRLDPAGEADPDVARARAAEKKGIVEDDIKNNAKAP